MRNLALSLIEKERIRTTLTKAKEMRGFVEGIIELGKSGGLHNRRRAFALMGNKTIATATGERRDPLVKVFGELATRYASRKGGYTRIYKLGNRPGDAAPMALIELVYAKLEVIAGKPEVAEKAESKPKKETKAKAKKASAKDAA